MSKLGQLMEQKRELETILGQRIHTSVRLGSVFISANEIQSTLNRFGHNLVYYTHDADYEVQLIGSATGLYYRNINFLIATRHQVSDLDPQDIGIIVHDESVYITSAGVSQFTTPPGPYDDDAQDICAFDFTPQAGEKPEIERRFFSLSEDVCTFGDEDVLAYLAYGFAFEDQRYDVVDDNHIATVVRSITCKAEDGPSDLSLGKVSTISPMDFNPNGLSGGPVFAICLEGTTSVLKFAGIINRAGGGTIHFIKAQYIMSLLNHIVSADVDG